MAENSRATGVALSLTQSVALWTVLLPPLTEIRRHTPGQAPDFATDVRHAELVSASLTVAVGGIMSVMEKDPAPFLASLLISAVMATAYEYTLQTEGHKATVSTIHSEGNVVNHD